MTPIHELPTSRLLRLAASLVRSSGEWSDGGLALELEGRALRIEAIVSSNRCQLTQNSSVHTPGCRCDVLRELGEVRS